MQPVQHRMLKFSVGDIRFAALILVTNLIPLWGMKVFDWQVADCLMIYWGESFIILFAAVLKAIIWIFYNRSLWGIVFMTFITANCIGGLLDTGMTIAGMGGHAAIVAGEKSGRQVFHEAVFNREFLMACAVIAIFHLYDVVKNFVLGGEMREGAAILSLVFIPFMRIVLVYFIMVICMVVVYIFESPFGALFAIFLIKTTIDIYAYKYRRKEEPGPPEQFVG
jgi:hypothetical protein